MYNLCHTFDIFIRSTLKKERKKDPPWHWLPPDTPSCKSGNERKFLPPRIRISFSNMAANVFYLQFDFALRLLLHTLRQNLLSGEADLNYIVELSDCQCDRLIIWRFEHNKREEVVIAISSNKMQYDMIWVWTVSDGLWNLWTKRWFDGCSYGTQKNDASQFWH